MCGIVGLFLKDHSLEPSLGRFMASMLVTLSDRGPDSAGFAVYGRGTPQRVKLTLHGPADTDFPTLAAAVCAQATVTVRDDHAVISIRADQEDAVRAALTVQAPQIRVVGAGARMELYKGVGRPQEVAGRLGLAEMAGSHAIGHTRMATESAVTTAGAHPFSTGRDQCLVHNGSLSNHNGVRRVLRHEGIGFETDNDSEVAAGYLSWRMRQGARLDEALEAAITDLDGFYTFVVGTESGFGVLRDPVACKPAVIAETDRYVAFATEYRALAALPGIDSARVLEPAPARVYFWQREA